MEGNKRTATMADLDIPEAFKGDFKCPVCSGSLTDGPIFICENPQGHSICSKCHENSRGKTRRETEKKCPVCSAKLGDRRNLAVENMAAKLPTFSKLLCKYRKNGYGCSYEARFSCFENRNDGLMRMKEHEETCQERSVTCVYCDDTTLSMSSIKCHLEWVHRVVTHHIQGFPWSFHGARTLPPSGSAQFPLSIHTITVDKRQEQLAHWAHYRIDWKQTCSTDFLVNWCRKKEGDGNVTTMFWVSSPIKRVFRDRNKNKKYKYTLKISSPTEKDVFLFVGTRFCIPCHLSHDDVKKRRCALTLEKELVDMAKSEDGRVNYRVKIDEV